MRVQNTEIIDTFAEAFSMWGSRVIITADTPAWALEAARSMTGFATSIIGCKLEAGIEGEVPAEQTLDGRPGVSVLVFTPKADSLGKRLVERVGQSVMTCPTTACFNGLLNAEESVVVGGQLRYFGDGFQISKVLSDSVEQKITDEYSGRRLWRIPVMDGEFLVDERFGIQEAVGGGNILILGEDTARTLRASEAAVAAMREVPGVIMPFPGGIVRSGSKTSSKYKFLFASTNDAYCPTLRAFAPETHVPAEAGCVMEIVIDGLDLPAVEEATRRGIHAAAEAGALQVSAGNYGGTLGQYQIGLYDVLAAQPSGENVQ